MKRLLACAASALVIGALAFAGTSTPELEITSGATTTGVLTGAGGVVSYSNTNFAGWDLTIILGNSNSPSLVPYGMDMVTLSAECVSGAACSELDVQLSDINFTQPAPGLQTGYSATDTGSTASTTQNAWYSTTNAYFAETSSIGTVGPFVGAGTFAGMAEAVGPGTTTPYSLTIEDTFAGCSGSGCASYSTDANITDAPEPASLALVGTALLFCASKLRRRKEV
jgi:hypothetical protein